MPVDFDFLDKQLKRLKEIREGIPEFLSNLSEIKEKVQNHPVGTRLPSGLYREINDFSSSWEIEKIDRNVSETSKRIIIEKIDERITFLDKQRSDFIRKIPEIENQVKEIKKSIEDNLTIIEVSTVVVNSGKSSVSLRSQALLRVDIGDNNFIELPMKMLEFDSNSEIPSQGAKVIKYTSKKLNELQKQDQETVINYWGQVAPSTLYVMDMFRKVHKTESIVFSSGLYEKTIYEYLKTESKKKATNK